MAKTTNTTTMMKAITQDRYGSADVLSMTDVPTPVINDDQILVKVEAASVNPLDWHFMRATPAVMRLMSGLRAPKQPIRGVDVSGRVEAVGRAVTKFAVGDDVFGWSQAAFAEYVGASATNFVKKPVNLTHTQAAAVPIAAFTALQGLRDHGKITSDHRVLVIGASGGVGTFAVQIAKSHGAEVTGVCSTRNVEMVRSIGADHVVDYTKNDVTSTEHRYDIIFQLAGATSPLRLRRILTKTGTLVLSSGDGRMSGIDRSVVAVMTSPFVRQRLVSFIASENSDDLVTIARLLESGAVTPVIDRTYPLAETPEAIRYVEEGHTQGKIVIVAPSGEREN